MNTNTNQHQPPPLPDSAEASEARTPKDARDEHERIAKEAVEAAVEAIRLTMRKLAEAAHHFGLADLHDDVRQALLTATTVVDAVERVESFDTDLAA
jgi:hypothetical protein